MVGAGSKPAPNIPIPNIEPQIGKKFSYDPMVRTDLMDKTDLNRRADLESAPTLKNYFLSEIILKKGFFLSAMKIAAKNAKDREEKNLYPGVPWRLGGKHFHGLRGRGHDEPS